MGICFRIIYIDKMENFFCRELSQKSSHLEIVLFLIQLLFSSSFSRVVFVLFFNQVSCSSSFSINCCVHPHSLRLTSLSIKNCSVSSSFSIKGRVCPYSQSSVEIDLFLNQILRISSVSIKCQDCPCSLATRLSSFLIKCQDCALS